MTDHHPKPRMLRGDEAQIYASHHASLEAAVRWAAQTSDQVVQDACAHAWLQFLRRQPDRDHVGPWLRTVAIRHGWQLAERDRRELPLERLAVPDDRIADPAHLDTKLEARGALRAVADLPPAQRQCLALSIRGLSRTEVATSTGRTVRNVDKQLGRARRRVRLVYGQRASD